MADLTTPQGWAERWGPSSVPKPPVRTVDVHAHMLVPESAELTAPHFKPEMDPRTFFSSPMTKELNAEFYKLTAAKYTDPETRLADMDALGLDCQLVGLSPFHYFYWADADLSPRVAALQNEKIAEFAAFDPAAFGWHRNASVQPSRGGGHRGAPAGGRVPIPWCLHGGRHQRARPG
jgi:hypothetical protein